MAASTRACRLPLRDRRSLPAAGARPRREGRAPPLAVEPLLVVAARRLRGALDRRREASDRSRCPSGGEATLTYGQYRAILATNRSQDDRAAAFHAFHKTCTRRHCNTYASLYNGVLQRDWFYSQARGYASTLEAALHGNNIPTAVVENLIAQTKAGTEPLRRYHRLRKRVLGLDSYHSLRHGDSAGRVRRKYPYDDVLEWLPASVAPLGPAYQQQMRTILNGQCIDVYENAGKKSGAYSAPVYGVPAVHAAELQRHAGRGVHAGPRDRPLDAHGPVARASAVRVRGLHDLRRRGALDAERGAVPPLHARPRHEAARADRTPAARDRRHRRHVLYAGDVRRLRAAGAPAGRGGQAGHGRRARRYLLRAAEGVPRRRLRLRRAVADHVGAHPALLRHAVLRLPVRDLLRIERGRSSVSCRPRRRGSGKR